MGTSLKRQLASLASPSTSLLVPDRRRSSILFSPSDAAKYDRDTFHQIGLEGLQELVAENESLFIPFLESVLFSEEGKKYERIMEDKEANEQLDKEISKFLLTLHPYLMMKASLKCLEWLVHRFHIERFNVGAVLQCSLPYYDTKTFVMIVQVLDIQYQVHHEWQWLIPCKQSGAPLRKNVLFDNCNTKFVCGMFETFESLVRVHYDNLDNLRVYLGFLAGTVVGILSKLRNDAGNKDKMKRIHSRKIVGLSILNKIHELINLLRGDATFKGLRNNEEIFSMIYIVMAMLAVCCHQIPEMAEIVGAGLKKIFKLIIVKRGSVQQTETFLLLNSLIDFLNRNWNISSEQTFNNTLGAIKEVSEQWDVSNLTTKLLIHNLEGTAWMSPKKVLYWIGELDLSLEARSDVLRRTYSTFVKVEKSKAQAKDFLVQFERSYPLEFELAARKDQTLVKALARCKKGANYLTLSSHSNSSVRASAVEKLIKRATTTKVELESPKNTKFKPRPKAIVPDRNKFAAALAPRFVDESQKVLLALLKTKVHSLLKIFSKKSLVNGIVAALPNIRSIRCKKFAIFDICGVAKRCKAESPLLKQIVPILLPYLFPRSVKSLTLTYTILRSDFAKSNEFLRQYSHFLEKDAGSVTYTDICQESCTLMATLDPQFKEEIVANLETPLQATLCCILQPTVEVLPKLLAAVEQMDCGWCTTYPTQPEDFQDCVNFAKKNQRLSFELLLTALSKMHIQGFADSFAVVKFVWKQSERLENRDAGMNFLKGFFKGIFKSQFEQYQFWSTALRDSSIELETDEEFIHIRCLQFATAFLTKLRNVPGFSEVSEVAVKHARKSICGKSSAKKQPEDGSGNIQMWDMVEVILTLSLQHDSQRVRRCSIECLKAAEKAMSEQDEVANFIKEFLVYENEVAIDSNQISNAVSHAISHSGGEKIQSTIVENLKRDCVSETKKLGLLKLCKAIEQKVFDEVYPSLKGGLHKQQELSKFASKLLLCYDGSFNETFLQEIISTPAAARAILKKIDATAYDSYKAVEKKKIYSILVEKALHCESPEMKVSILRCVKKWPVDATIVAAELNKSLELEKRQVQSKLSKGEHAQRGEDWVARAEVVLEFIQGKHLLKNKTKLIQPLFKILSKCITMEEQNPVEYLKQLVLSSLTLCCQEEEDQESTKNAQDFASFDVQTVIDCLRCSRNPQTHHHALILLNYAASRYHEQVLHGIMSLFTFMGNSILRQDDSYSTQLIQQTVVNIIPSLAKTSRGKIHSLTLSAGIFRVFTSAVQDIPVHRRLPVFASLVQTLDPQSSLWQLCIILVDNALQRDRKRSNLNADLELAVDLVWQFSPNLVAKVVCQVFNFVVSLPIFTKNVPVEEFGQMKLRQSQMEKSVLDFGRKDSFKDVLITVHYVLELMTQICGRFTEIEDSEVEYDTVIEKSLIFSKKISGLSEEKMFRLIAHKNLELIDKVNMALDPLKFVEAVALILVRDDLAVKRKVLEIFNHRILQKVEWFGNLENLLELIPLLIEVSSQESETDETTTLIQTAFFSLKLLAKNLATQHPDSFVPVFDLVSVRSNDKNMLLRASAILCLSELFCLKSLILPKLSDVTGTILKAFKASSKLQSAALPQQEDEEDDTMNLNEEENNSMTAHLLCISTMTCLNKMIDNMGSFVGMKFIKKALVAVLSISSSFGRGEKAVNRRKVFEQKLKSMLKIVATRIPLRNMVNPIREAFIVLRPEPLAASMLIKILKDSLAHTSKPDFMLLVDSLSDAFIADFLCVREKAESDNFLDIEDSVIDCLISGVVLKLTESHFRPLYHKIFDWAKGNDERLVTFYRFSAAAAERLKSLFVTFAGHVMQEALQVLHKNVLLAKAVVRFFYHIFSNDKEGFVTIDRFNSIVQPLLDMIESEYVLGGEIPMNEVSDCLVQLAVATNDLNRWQHLVELIALKSGHSNKEVRLNVLSTMEAVATELAKDFLPLLPPAVPFLAELMSDDDQEVETTAHKLLQKLEAIVGEDLQPYFAT